jgi:multidrug resistance protein, MATE family
MYLIEVITLIFVGHLNDPAIIAGAGIGSMLNTMMGLAITCGMNSALSTLISQSYGQNNMRLCGVYYNQARIMVTLLFLPILIVMLNADNLFLAFGFEPHVCAHAQTFINYRLPHLYFFSLYDATKRLLYNTGY